MNFASFYIVIGIDQFFKSFNVILEFFIDFGFIFLDSVKITLNFVLLVFKTFFIFFDFL